MRKNAAFSRVLSAVLTIAMMFSMIPFSMSVSAATELHPDGVTITVSDENGNALAGATVSITVDSVANGDGYIEETKTTDETGTVEVISKEDYVENDLKLTAKVTKTGYKIYDIETTDITSVDQDFEVTLISTTISGVIIEGVTETYVEGLNVPAVKVSGTKKGDVVTYKLGDGEFSESLPMMTAPGEYKVIVKVEREGYDTFEKTVTSVVELNTIVLEVTEYKGNFDGKTHPSLIIEGLASGDECTYTLNNEKTSKEIPEIYDVGKYTVAVTVKRYGYTTYENTFSNIEIIATDILGYTAMANSFVYDGTEKDAVFVTSEKPDKDDKVEYQMGESGIWSENVPKIKDVGEYIINVRVSKTNYNTTEVKVVPAKAVVSPAPQFIEFNKGYSTGSFDIDLNANEDQNTYDFSATFDETQSNAKVIYSVKLSSNSDANCSNIAVIDNEGQLTVKNAGAVVVTATRPGTANYEETSVSCTVVIKNSAKDLIYFDDSYVNYTFGTTKDGVISNQKVEYKHTDDNGAITYRIDKTNIGVSCDVNTGKVSISDYEALSAALENGSIEVAVNAHKDPVQEEITSTEISQKPDGKKSVYFSNNQGWDKVYIYFWDSATVCNQFPGVEMKYVKENELGEKVYRYDVPDDVKGIVFSAGSDQNQTVDIENIEHNIGYYLLNQQGRWNVGTYPWKDDSVTITEVKDKYDDCDTSYIIKISTEDIPENPYKLSGTLAESGWYASNVDVIPNDKYYLATSVLNEFTESVNFSDQGKADRYVYLRNKTTGGITSKIKLDGVKIDTIAPDANNMEITYSEPNFIEKLGKIFGFYNPNITITFRVDDEIAEEESGVDFITWYYNKETDATSSILSEKTGVLKATRDEAGYVAEITLKASDVEQLRGNVSFTATDFAGLTSGVVTDNDRIIVIDTINPVMSATHSLVDVNGVYTQENNQHYYNGDVKFTFTVTEANFFEEDVVVKVSKDGKAAVATAVAWITSSTDDEVRIGEFTLSGDGDYIVTMTYTDNAGNVQKDKSGVIVKEYRSDLITIDTAAAILGSSQVDKTNQTTKFTINERNFDPAKITVTGTITNIKGEEIAMTPDKLTSILRSANWKNNSDNSYSFVYDYSNGNSFYDGIYDLKVLYSDYSSGTPITLDMEEFIIDSESPVGVTIEYSDLTLKDRILDIITLGFYNPDVTVKFVAYDKNAGVKDFTWSYKKQLGATNVNHPDSIEDTTIKAIQDEEDKSRFYAEMTLKANEFEQYKGNLSVFATDNYDNISKKFTDEGYVIVVDTIAPEITVEYSKENRLEDANYYYNGDFTATFKVTEANCFSEDIKITLVKDGVEETPVTLDWISEDNNLWVSEYTVSGDGHYVFKAEYTDKTQNKMNSYESDVRTIDTIAPVIDVTYENNYPVNTLKDSENHERKYFGDTQVSTIKITEHNFKESEVDFSKILSKDVAEMELENDSIEFSQWSHIGDEHTITVTYNGDANYSFDVDYTDLATNKATDYTPDYFTVDKTAPERLTVSYSTSLLETILESVSFGFYNAKMTVTITADDDTSPINQFVYNYTKSAGVSSVNAELINQAITEADIAYSDNNQTATAKFEIPKFVLQNDNQFNGTVAFIATDRAGNSTDQKDNHRIVVDNIAPVCNVTYNQSVNEVNGISYYDGNIDVNVRITEANFYSENVVIAVTKDGVSYPVNPRWSNASVDVHNGTFTLTEDGDYTITVNYSDKSNNRMTAYESNQLTIDTSISEPVFSINGVNKGTEGGAYKGDVTVAFSYEDQNYASKTIRLTRTLFDKVEDVTDEFISTLDNDKGGSGSFDVSKVVENDGIYELTIGITDKANHTTESSMKFTINRFGSVYEYSDYLVSLIKDGGQYITIAKGNKAAITEDLIITEYNADRILKDSLKILITRDGEAIDAEYTTSPSKIDDQVAISNAGWYKYVYTIKASNFAKDGVYKISLTSAYASSDSDKNDSTSVPENSITAKGEKILDTMSFTVDTTAPEIRNIANLENAIVNAQTLDVKYTIVDVGGLKSVEVILNGKAVDTITEFGDSVFNYSGQFTINESTDAQTVQLKVMDLAGNVTDTASEDFSTGDLYVFNDVVTVSTNFFVRFYANKLLFWGSIGGVIVLAAAILVIIAAKRKKKES